MTTAVVATSTFPGAIGDGTPQFVYDLTSRLSSVDRIIVVAPRVPGAPRRERLGRMEVRRFAYFPKRWEGVANGATLPNVRAEPWRMIELPTLFAAFYFNLLWVLIREKVDLVHAHWVLPSALFAALVPRRWRPPIVATAHGVDMYAKRSFPFQQLRRFALKRTARVVAVSSDLERVIRDVLPNAAVSVAPMGASFAEIRQRTIPRDPVANRITFLGRLADKKGVDILLQALTSVPSATLHIAGDGPERASLQRLSSELGLDDRVEFLGKVSRERVFELLRTTMVLVIPSVVGTDGDQEGTPVVFAEASAAGVPVIASAIGGLADLLNDSTGYVVPPSDRGALVAALNAALADPDEANRRAARSLRDLAPQLDIETTASVYDSIYRDLLS